MERLNFRKIKRKEDWIVLRVQYRPKIAEREKKNTFLTNFFFSCIERECFSPHLINTEFRLSPLFDRKKKRNLKGGKCYHMVTYHAEGDVSKVFQYFGRKRRGVWVGWQGIMPCRERGFFLDIQCILKAYKKKYRAGASWKQHREE